MRRARTSICIVLETLDALRRKGVPEELILLRDLQGYFDHVVTLHPFADRDRHVRYNETHEVVELAGSPRALARSGRPAVAALRALLRAAVCAARLSMRERVAVVRAHDPFLCGLIGLISARLRRVPLVVLVFSNYEQIYRGTGQMVVRELRLHVLERLLSWTVLHAADLVLAASVNVAEYAHGAGASRGKTHVLRIGVDQRHSAGLDTRTNRRGELSLTARHLLIYCGRLSSEKYAQDAIRVLAQVINHGRDAGLLMLGDGPQRAEMEALAMELGVGGRVQFLGFRPADDVRDLLFTADVIVSPLTGAALVESALSATPVVAYDYEWQSELIRPHETGLLAPFRDVEGMAKAVEWVLDHPSEAADLGQRAREAALAQHSLDAVAQQERRYLETVMPA